MLAFVNITIECYSFNNVSKHFCRRKEIAYNKMESRFLFHRKLKGRTTRKQNHKKQYKFCVIWVKKNRMVDTYFLFHNEKIKIRNIKDATIQNKMTALIL